MSRCHCVSSTGALLSVPVRDSCIYLLSLNVPDHSCQGQLLGRIMVGMITLQTRTRPEQDSPNAPCQRSLPCAFSRSAVSHTGEAFEGPAPAESFVKQKTASWNFFFPLNRFLIISTNIACGSGTLPCAICVH